MPVARSRPFVGCSACWFGLPTAVRMKEGTSESPSPIESMQLTRLGPYEIEQPLGKGGMGSVYAATDSQTGQRVAIKALSPQLAMAEGFRELFDVHDASTETPQ